MDDGVHLSSHIQSTATTRMDAMELDEPPQHLRGSGHHTTSTTNFKNYTDVLLLWLVDELLMSERSIFKIHLCGSCFMCPA